MGRMVEGNKGKDITTSSSDGGDGGDDYNPSPHVMPEGENATPLEVIGATAKDKLVIIMVGLPGTGKTHIAKRICRFISFFHDIPSRIFNVGDYRRQMFGSALPASFYDPTNEENVKQRHECCGAALQDLITYMNDDDDDNNNNNNNNNNSGVRLAIYDATNSTRERRRYITEKIRKGTGTKLIFIESICTDTTLLEENIRSVKIRTPDYKGVDSKEAIADFHQRRANYASVYESVEDDEGTYLQVLNSKKFVVHNMRGYLPLKVVHFVMNLHTMPRTFYLTRHGQSEYNLLGKIGGDSGLSANGLEYAKRLAHYAETVIGVQPSSDKTDDDTASTPKKRPARLWTSTMRRTKETAQFIDKDNRFEAQWDNGDKNEWVQFRPMAKRNLDELYAGMCDGMTYKEIQERFPDEFARRQHDKLAYRYPRGESYMDVTLRLEPLAHEMERTREPVLVIGHQGILRIIYAYFMGLSRSQAPYVAIPLNHVIVLSPHAYGCHEERVCLMDKSEMLKDGQDEPITSMPILQLAAHTSKNKNNEKQQDSLSSQQAQEEDEILNAPSC